MITLLQTPLFIIFASVTIIAVTATIAEAWTKTKRASLEAELKLEMLRQGMSADDIVRVTQSSGRSKKSTPADADHV